MPGKENNASARFAGKTVIVTGASAGIGRAVAHNFAAEGANVTMLDVDFDKLSEVKSELAAYSDRVLTLKCDVSSETEVAECVKATNEKFGKTDILVNNAGLWRYSYPFLEITDELWSKLISVNIMGTVYCTRAVLPGMIERGYGRIINLASVAGVYGNADMSAYSATKGAIISLTKALAKEVADKGVVVNSVSPGTVNSSKDPDMDGASPCGMCYAGRHGSHNENARLILFLAGDEAAYINGQNIQIDGVRKSI